MYELVYENESVQVLKFQSIKFSEIPDENVCECTYDEDNEVVEYCNKNHCPNL